MSYDSLTFRFKPYSPKAKKGDSVISVRQHNDAEINRMKGEFDLIETSTVAHLRDAVHRKTNT